MRTFADVLGVVLFGATAIVAGLGLLRPAAGMPVPATETAVHWGSWLAALTAVAAAVFAGANPFMMTAHAALALALPALLHRAVGAFVAGAALTTILVLETAYESSIVDIRVAPVYSATAVVLLGAVVVVGSRVEVRRVIVPRDPGPLHPLRPTRQARDQNHGPLTVAATAVVVAAGFGLSEVLVPDPVAPPAARPGEPVVHEVHLAGQHLPVLVTPQRPGRNLVLVGGEADGVLVGAGTLVAAEERAGAEGRWAAVELPAGPGRVWLERGGERVAVPVDTGHGEPAPASATGADGPECASAALGAVLGGRAGAHAACPADSLTGADEATLRGLVAFLGRRGVATVAVAADGSPRSVAASAAVRDAAARAGIGVAEESGADSALLVVSGWTAADATLTEVADRQRTGVTYGFGTYLAPWLLAAPVVKAISGTVIPLRFDPRDADPVRYQLALASRFHGQHPTTSGYRGWFAAGAETDGTRLYAASLVAFLPADLGGGHQHGGAGGWLPGGTVVPVTGPLDAG